MKTYPATRSAGSKYAPCAHFIRFTEEENRRLHKAKGGSSVQAFCRAAVLRAVIEVETKLAQAKEIRATREREKDLERQLTAPQPRGLGIRERLESDPATVGVTHALPEEPEPTASPPPTVTVQVQPTPTASPNVQALAHMVVDGNGDRRRLLERACQALAATVHSQEERLHLADRLDAEIKRIEGASAKTVLERVRARRRL